MTKLLNEAAQEAKMFNRIRNVRKRWFVVAAASALLAIGLVSGTVFAAGAASHVVSGNPHHGYGHYDYRAGKGDASAVMARVAEILGIEQDTLESAFATALDEKANTRFEEYVQGLADDETLTSEQATAANDWFDERPSNSGPMAIRLARTSDSDKVDTFLEKLVDGERLTQDESDALSDWHDDRPDSLPTVSRKHGRHGHGDSDGAGESNTRWGWHGDRG